MHVIPKLGGTVAHTSHRETTLRFLTGIDIEV